MTPAANEKKLAGRWIVWWRHESRAAVGLNGKIINHEMRKIWRYGQVARKTSNLLTTKQFERILTRDVFIVDEIANWPTFSPGVYRPLTNSEFSELTRCQP